MTRQMIWGQIDIPTYHCFKWFLYQNVFSKKSVFFFFFFLKSHLLTGKFQEFDYIKRFLFQRVIIPKFLIPKDYYSEVLLFQKSLFQIVSFPTVVIYSKRSLFQNLEY